MATREGLYEALDRFREALAARDPTRVEWARNALCTENNVALEPGDGLWNTLTSLGPYDLRFADAEQGQVALFTSVEETDAVSPCAIRLALREGVVAEAEIVVARNKDEGFAFHGQTFEDKPAMLAEVPAAGRSSREELVRLANGYFETIERNDGTIRTRFHAHCNRVENGVRTTNNADFPLPIARLGCEEQFALGWYRYDDELRARRFPLVDIERGIVLAHGFIDHSGKLGDYLLTDGTPVTSPIRRPHSYCLAEAFKIRDGAIEQVEAVFHTVPYRMASPWDRLGEGERPMTPTRRWLSLGLIALVYVMDGWDINAMAMAVPRLEEPLGLPAASFGWVFSALLIGMGAAAALLAPLGDRIGRRPLIVFGCLTVAIATLGTALATSIPEFIAWRVVTGAGLGAALPNCTAMSAELAPERLRATLMSVVSAGIPLGLFAAGWFAPAIVDVGGWQGLFVVPGLFAGLLAIVLWWVLPAEAPAASPTAPAAAKVPQLELLKPPARFPFAVFAGALALNAVNLYMLNSWLPTVLPQAGFTLDEAARLAGVLQLAGLALGILVSGLIDRWRPGATLVISFAVMTACFVAIGLMPADPGRWTVLLLVGVGGASAAGLALPALTAYLFPPRLLASAVGMGVLVARIGAIGGPLVGQAMLTAAVPPHLFLAAAAVPAGLAALICLAIPAALAARRRAEAGAAA